MNDELDWQRRPRQSLMPSGLGKVAGQSKLYSRSPQQRRFLAVSINDQPSGALISEHGCRIESSGWAKTGRRRRNVALKVGLAAILLLSTLSLVITRIRAEEDIRPVRPVQYGSYQHLDFSQPITLDDSTRILHVTKEFGPATMGGLGVMLTALSLAQAESKLLEVAVVIPYYSFLRKDFHHKTTIVTKLDIDIVNADLKSTRIVECEVRSMDWYYTPAFDFLKPTQDGHDDHAVKDSSLPSIKVYMIGPGNQSPFDVAFQTKDAGDIYSAYKPLQQEWKDLWFAKAVAALVESLNEGRGSTNGATIDERKKVEVVHLHGATNAMVAYYLRKRQRVLDSRSSSPGPAGPAIVYTLHDSLDEVEYSNLAGNVVRFLDLAPSLLASSSSSSSSGNGAFIDSAIGLKLHSRQMDYDNLPIRPITSLTPLEPWIYSERTPRSILPTFFTGDRRELFTSSLGIDLADQITLVSKSIASDIVSGEFNFSLSHLVMPSIAHRAALGDFIGVTNGLDFTQQKKNPWTSRALLSKGLAFPRVGAKDLLHLPALPTGSEEMDYESDAISFLDTKLRAKRYLVDHLPLIFTAADIERPFLLFIGRFQYNKGCQFFEPILRSISSTLNSQHNARLIIMGAANNYPLSDLQKLQRQYPSHFTLIDDADFQEQWGTILRMASDFSLVPSFSEAFGLVAAEGLLFGMPVISSGVGGLREFLRPISSSPTHRLDSPLRGNAHLFSIFDPSAADALDLTLAAIKSRPSLEALSYGIKNCVDAVNAATTEWRRTRDRAKIEWSETELGIRRMIADALALEWSKERGPVEEYIRVYDRALQVSRL